MQMTRTQLHRQIGVGTPLGDDVLLLQSVAYEESIGRPFEMHLELVSEKFDVDFKQLVGQNLTVRLDVSPEEERYLNGYVSRFALAGRIGRVSHYRATVVPWFWFLTRAANCRIFQNQSAQQIIEDIFKERGFNDYELQLKGSYPEWEYCVQYRETDFNFVSRLMEQVGIYYYFTHENGKHTLVLADGPKAHEPIPGVSELPYRQPDDDAFSDRDYVWQWSHEQRVQPGTYALNDFDFKAPRKALHVKSSAPSEHPHGEYEVYDYPGEYTEYGDGETYAKVRLEELQARHELVAAESNCRRLYAGGKFSLTDHPRDAINDEYLLTSMRLRAATDPYDSAGGGDANFECSFSAIPAAVTFRPPRITPKPVIQGPQTAIVVGKKGEEIWTDEHGRVKVQFHWDRYGQTDEKSSCWIRVSQGLAGTQWGAIHLPRIGQEVIVEFLEGDPDRPIITGRVYNGQTTPPYKLPDEKTKSTVKTNSSKGGGGFNEIRFEDKKDDEQIFIHAQKDEDHRVKNDLRELIENERHLIVKTDQLEQVDGDKHLTVKGDQNEKVKGTLSQDVKMDLQQKVGMKHALDAGMEVHIKSGMKVVVEGSAQVTLKVGGNFIDINPGGVFIKGTVVMINSGGAAGSGSGASPDAAKAPKEADDGKPGKKDKPPKAPKPPTVKTYSAAATVLKRAARDGTPFCEKCAAAAAAAGT